MQHKVSRIRSIEGPAICLGVLRIYFDMLGICFGVVGIFLRVLRIYIYMLGICLGVLGYVLRVPGHSIKRSVHHQLAFFTLVSGLRDC